MQLDPETGTFDRVTLLDEHLYCAYQRAQRCTEDWQQASITAEIRNMQRERAAMIEDLLTILKATRDHG